MSTNFYQNPPSNPLHDMTALYRSSLTTQAIEEALVSAGNLARTKFMFNPWVDIPNSGIGGNRGGLKPYAVLPRMTLIPLYAWQVAKIKNRTSGNISGEQVIGKVRVGTITVQANQLADESEAFISKAYGKLPIVALNSLTADDDITRREAFMLFEAAMRVRRSDLTQEQIALLSEEEFDEFPNIRGVDVLMEDLPDFLKLGAPIALRFAVRHGMVVPDHLRTPLLPEDFYHFRPEAGTKGMAMLRDMGIGASRAVDLAVGPAGVLEISRSEISAAGMGQRDKKNQTDPLDKALLAQFPTFSMDTPIERAQRANEPLIRAIQESKNTAPQQDPELVRLLIEQNNMLMQKYDAMAQQISSLAAGAGTGPPVPPESAAVDAKVSGGDQQPEVATVTEPATETTATPKPETAKAKPGGGRGTARSQE